MPVMGNAGLRRLLAAKTLLGFSTGAVSSLFVFFFSYTLSLLAGASASLF